MRLTDSLTEYLEALASGAPVPGGGSASALCGAQGAALVAMVANLTVNSPKYAAEREICERVAREASALQTALAAQAEKDAAAFADVAAALKLPKTSPEEKAARADAIAAATLTATQAPFRTMQLCAEGLRAVKSLVGHSNVNAASDLGVAALNLIAGIRGAWLNVRINLGGLKSEAQAEEFRRAGAEMEAAASEAEEIYRTVLATL